MPTLNNLCFLVLLTTGGLIAAPFFPAGTPVLVVPSEYLASYLPSAGTPTILCPTCPQPPTSPTPATPKAYKKAKAPAKGPVEPEKEQEVAEEEEAPAEPPKKPKSPKAAAEKSSAYAEAKSYATPAYKLATEKKTVEAKEAAAMTAGEEAIGGDEGGELAKDLTAALMKTNVPGQSAIVMKNVPGKQSNDKKLFFAGVVGGTEQDVAKIAQIAGVSSPKSPASAPATPPTTAPPTTPTAPGSAKKPAA